MPTGTPQKVFTHEPLRDVKTFLDAVTTSTDIATMIGEALPDGIEAVTISATDADLNYQADGNDATATSFLIKSGQAYTAYGDKDALDNIRLYGASSVNVGLIAHASI